MFQLYVKLAIVILRTIALLLELFSAAWLLLLAPLVILHQLIERKIGEFEIEAFTQSAAVDRDRSNL